MCVDQAYFFIYIIGSTSKAVAKFSFKETLLSYKAILEGNGFGLLEAKRSIDIVHAIRNSKPLGLKGDYHPYCKS